MRAQRSLTLIGALLLLALPAYADTRKAAEEEREGGIVGTGIVGTIQSLGSIIVNGRRITFDDTLMVPTPMGEKPARMLRPGETVAVNARPAGSDWEATGIAVMLPLLGPAEIEDGRLTILGSEVATGGADLTEALGPIEADAWYAVSGLWQDRRIMATRIERVAPGTAQISGSYFPLDEGGGFRVGGTTVTGLDLAHVSTGDVVTVRGVPGPAGLGATDVRIGLFDEPMGMILSEGYLSPPMPGGLYTVLGSGLVAYTDNPGMIDPTSVGLFCAQAGGGEGIRPVNEAGAAACLEEDVPR